MFTLQQRSHKVYWGTPPDAPARYISEYSSKHCLATSTQGDDWGLRRGRTAPYLWGVKKGEGVLACSPFVVDAAAAQRSAQVGIEFTFK